MSAPSAAGSITFLRERLTRAPRVALVLGSGLGLAADELADPLCLPYETIPGFPRSTVKGHAGELIAGIWQGVEVVVLKGRFHWYEGWPASSIALPIRCLAALGVEYLFVTNAAGSIREDLQPGSLMLIADHLNFMFRNPLSGPCGIGEDRFPDMSDPYDGSLREIAKRSALDRGIPLVEGVYAAVAGPSYETPAEIRMLGRLGADAVGMSTVPEVLVARALGLRVLGLSCITNRAATSGGEKLGHEDVLRVGREAAHRMTALLRAVIPRAVPSNLPSEAAG